MSEPGEKGGRGKKKGMHVKKVSKKAMASSQGYEGVVLVQRSCSLALEAARVNLEVVLAASAYSTSPEHAQAAVAAARANLVAAEQAQAVERSNELALWQRDAFNYLRLPLNHKRPYLPPLPYRDPDIPYFIEFFANRRIMKRCFQAIVRYLDPQSVMNLRMVTKEINREGERAMYRVWRYLAAVNYSSPFITLPAVGGGEGQMSYTKAVYDLFFANKRQEVLIMGGGYGHQITKKEVTKMIVEPNGTIRFEVSPSMLLKPRDSQGTVYHQGEILSISTGDSPDSSFGTTECFDTLTQAQTELAERLPNNLRQVAAAIFGNKFVVVGGRCDIGGQEVVSDIVYELNEDASKVKRGKWRALTARLNTARLCAAIIVFEGKLFLCGGLDANYAGLRSVEYLDPATGAWQIDSNMTKKRWCFTLFVYESELYAVGGDRGATPKTTIEKRNKVTQQWELVAKCGENRWACATALLGSGVFLFGGELHMSSYDFFDLHTKKWLSKTKGIYEKESTRQMPCKVWHSRAVLITLPAETKEWTDLNVLKREDWDTVKCDEQFEAITGKVIQQDA